MDCPVQIWGNRVEAIQDNANARVYGCGMHTISPATRRLHLGEREVEIEAKVFDLILLLLENRERALPKQEVITALWGHRPITDAALSQLVHKARRALDDDGERQAVIRTIYGRGLQWVAPVDLMVANSTRTLGARMTHDAPVTSGKSVSSHGGRRARRWRGVLAALLVLGALSSWFIPRGMAPPAKPPLRMALLPIDNATGDAALDWATRGLPGLIASLLGDHRDLHVVDPLQVARVWNFTPPKGSSRAEHTRYVTDANVLVGGKLTRTAGKLYQLTIHVDTGKPGNAINIVIIGSDPGTVSLAAVPRLRHALLLDPSATSSFHDTPKDAYLAETFARGIDLAMHGDWLGARPYLMLVARGQPDLLAARLMLAMSQGNTDQLREADAGYAAVLAEARRRGQIDLAARVLADQVAQATDRHEDAKAMDLAARALAAAHQARNPEITASVLLAAARVQARLKHVDIAMKQFDQARELIEKTPIRSLQPRLHNTMAFIANARNDAAAAIAAARAELDADEMLGNERGSSIAGFNLAYALSTAKQPLEALPLLVRTWNWSSQHHDDALQIAAGNLMSALLYDMGVYEEIRPVVDTTEQIAAAQANDYIQAQVLGLRAGGEYFRDNKAAALADCRKATSLIDPAEDPSTAIEKRMIEAFVAIAAAPGSVAAIRRRADDIAGHMSDPADVRSMQYLIHALAAAATGNLKGVQAALDAAASAPHASRDLVHQITLQIALVTHNDAIAQNHLRDFNPVDADVTADTLRLYGAWAARNGDRDNQRRARARLDAMRKVPLDILAKAHFDPAGAAGNNNARG